MAVVVAMVVMTMAIEEVMAVGTPNMSGVVVVMGRRVVVLDHDRVDVSVVVHELAMAVLVSMGRVRHLGDHRHATRVPAPAAASG
jgi:hypothetical protein